MFGIPPWTVLKPRAPVNKPSVAWVNAVTRVLATLRVRYSPYTTSAYFDRPNRDGSEWSLVLPWPTSVTEFSGRAYAPNGKETALLNSDAGKAWIKFRRDTYEFSEETGPPSTPWPSNEVWFRKAGVAGDIVVVM